jgi:hypothetical protein
MNPNSFPPSFPAHLARRLLLGLLPAMVMVPVMASPQAAQTSSPSTPMPVQVQEGINPMTGEPAEAEALRQRLARLQVQSRIEAELTAIERSRQERQHLQAPESHSALPAFFAPSVRPRFPTGKPPGLPVATGHAPAVSPPSQASAPGVLPPTVPAPPAIAPRLVAIVQDGSARFALAETPAGLEPLKQDAQASEAPDDTFSLGGAGLHLPQAPGHIDLPRAPSPERPGPPAAANSILDPGTVLRSGFPLSAMPTLRESPQ